MPTQAELNQFRRLIGDFETEVLTDSDIESVLNDAVSELTGNLATPTVDFDLLLAQYHNEVIYKGALNWWWNQLSELQNKHSISVGQASQNVSEKWDRAWQMIQSLQATFDQIQTLWVDIVEGNYSRYSKQTLRRIGGIREEDTNA